VTAFTVNEDSRSVKSEPRDPEGVIQVGEFPVANGDDCAWAGSITELTIGLVQLSGSVLPVITAPLPAAIDFSNMRRLLFELFSCIRFLKFDPEKVM
jgi:hypothetical protein